MLFVILFKEIFVLKEAEEADGLVEELIEFFEGHLFHTLFELFVDKQRQKLRRLWVEVDESLEFLFTLLSAEFLDSNAKNE